MPHPVEPELDALSADVAALLRRHGFDRKAFVDRVSRLGSSSATDNRVEGTVEPPAAGDVLDVETLDAKRRATATDAGSDALARGEVALVVLAGGMATRMGGVVKALVEALPGKRFLDLRLSEQGAVAAAYGKEPPLWLMTSHATDSALSEALGPARDGYRIATFVQGLGLRVTPEGRLFRDAQGQPSVHATGHGDLPDALRASGLLDAFIARGGRTLMVANLDNLGAALDPFIIGLHLHSGAPVTCEVVEKAGSDRGGIPVRWNGRPVILEELRLPTGFDASRVRVFNTNTFLFDALSLRDLIMDWTYLVVEKPVGDARALQLERLVNEVTTTLTTRYLKVSRRGATSRFVPVKDRADLERVRPDLQAIAQARGML